MSNLDYNLPEPTKAQLEYARYLSRFQAPRERRTLFAPHRIGYRSRLP